MKKILATGARGQLGQCIKKIAGRYATLDFSFKSSKELDITNPDLVNRLFDAVQFDFCINCAAYTNVEQAEKTPEIAFNVNAEGVKNLALACKAYNVKLIHISTDYVFDGENEKGYLPTDKPNPINEYGKSKLRGEEYIQEILNEFLIIRTSWLYSEYGKNFHKTILRKAKAGEDLRVTDEQKGCPTNATNLAEFLLNLLFDKKFKSGIQHFTDGVVMTWFEFAQKILNDNNLSGTIKLVRDKNYRTFAKRPKNSTLNSKIAINE